MIFKWKYKPSGNCPVQAEGYFLGKWFYFRSRWDEATITFAKSEVHWEQDNVIKFYILWNTEVYEAGYISKSLAKFLVFKGCLYYWLGIKGVKL